MLFSNLYAFFFFAMYLFSPSGQVIQLFPAAHAVLVPQLRFWK